MKFIAKSVIVEAVRFVETEVMARTQGHGIDLDTGVSFVRPPIVSVRPELANRVTPDVSPEPVVLTSDGRVPVYEGDWIVTYPDGRTELLKPAVFTATFQPVNQESAR
jgi:hypothetical protein